MRSLPNRTPARRRSGAAMVEMAIVLPVFMAVTFGIVEFGRAMMVGQMVTNAAREGARYAVVDGSTNAQVETVVKEFLGATSGATPDQVDVTIVITPAAGNDDPGNDLSASHAKDLVTVTVQIAFSDVSFLQGAYLDSSALKGQCSMRHE